MNKLLTQNRLKKRAAELVRLWSLRDSSVSPIAHDRYWLLMDKLRGGRSWPLKWISNAAAEVRAFVAGADMVTILGWDVNEEPALIVAVDKLLANLPNLAQIYPDGFVLINDAVGKAFLLDLDDHGETYVGVTDLPSQSA